MFGKTSRRDFLKASALVSAGTILAACGPATTTEGAPGNNPATTAKKKVVFSTYVWSNFESALTEILNGWVAKTPGVEYEAQFVPQTIDYWAKIQTQVASGTPPDCGMADYGRVASYAKNGTLMDITPYIESSKFPIDQAFPGGSAQYRWLDGEFSTGAPEGKYFGIPSDAQSQIFAYNKTMFKDAGVDLPTDDWTWDNVLEAAQKITKSDQNKWGIRPIDNYILFKGNMVWAAGGALHSPDFTKSMLADPATTACYKWNWDLIYTHKVAPLPGSSGDQNPFMSGQVAMVVDGVWWLTDFNLGIKDFEWDVALMPKDPKTGKRTVTVESDGWWVYKGAKDADTAWELISYMGGPEGQKLFVPANDCIPSVYEATAQEWYNTKPPENKLKVLDNIKMDSAKVDYTYFELATIQAATMPIIDKAFADGTDIVAAMADADKVMTEELTKAWTLYKS